MAKELVVRCDGDLTLRVKDCVENHDDTRTFIIRTDGEAWEVDLGGPHAEALLTIARRGRSVSPRAQDSTAALNRRIRGIQNVE